MTAKKTFRSPHREIQSDMAANGLTNALRTLASESGVSVEDAAASLDICEATAFSLLYKKKPSVRDISEGIRLYREGWSLKYSSLHSSVSPEKLGQAIARHEARRRAFKRFGII